ncbi:MAG: succinate dehydrogenase cytochrome b subunit [Cryomorphaceae bacterium]|jgi:succinate dehydrogenase / fumarate reductase cytochrome b subunit|nr:succinate dehydrogenase cytochrome b subunit [Cryomorphaceae bacterium]
MSVRSAFSSSIIKKVWMALTGLFLCTFLVGHLAGNMQLILKTGEEGRRAFNEYAYFMGHNPFIKVLSYVTYFSIIFHAVQGFYLTYQNKKARPQGYAYSKPGANSSLPSRYMAILGTIILVFIVTHMANFWWRAKIKEDIPLHTYIISAKDQMGQTQEQEMYYTHNLQLIPKSDEIVVKNNTELFMANFNVKIADGYKDLHTVVMDFFNPKKNDMALAYLLLYVVSMAVLAFHLWHGFASGFQSLGLNHKRYTPLIHGAGKLFALAVPGLFALITILIYLK